ncbi:hypothetical protein [Catellatospora sichuanensis]|uniref:hypothetical protein n=1 Tax=Catellatospora sichuanensis TaxID=1969805 RepID=UPI001C919D77|nr:hypothetical protein [Catellatospora sichuanensis]
MLRDISALGRTVVLTTYHLDEAESLCDRVAIMDHGRILQSLPPATLVRDLDMPACPRDIRVPRSWSSTAGRWVAVVLGSPQDLNRSRPRP